MTRQFDVYATPLRRDRQERPYVIVVQADWIDSASRVVAPLVDERFLRPSGRLNPGFRIEGRTVYFHPVELATFSVRSLKHLVTNLAADRDRIVAALDLVFTGI